MHWGHLCLPAWEHTHTHTHTCSQAQWIVYIFEPGAKVQRHKQETGSPSRAPLSLAFPYYKALPPPASHCWGRLFCLLFKEKGKGVGHSA